MKRLMFACGFAALALACAGEASAQAPASGEAVRERRTGSAPAVEAAAKADAGADGADGLRERLSAETRPAERARLQRELAERLAAEGRREEAVALLRSMLSEERFDPPFFYNVGNSLARLDEAGAAVEAYRKAVAQRRGSYARAQHNLGVVLTRLGRWEEAEAALSAALRLESFAYAEASYSLGRLHALRGEAGLAIEEWARTLRLKPDHAAAAVALARALNEDGDPAQALKVLDDFAARVSRREAGVPREVEIARGEVLAAANVAAAERAEKRAGTEAKGAARPTVVATVTSLSPVTSEDVVSIIRTARVPKQRALKVDGETYDLLMRARRARSEQRREEALGLYRAAVESGGGYVPPANMELGFTLESLGRNEEAAAALLEVIRRDGARYPIVFFHLGRYYERLGRLEQSAEAFERAAAMLSKEGPQFYIDLSRVREKQGRFAEALAALEEYLRLTAGLGTPPDWAAGRVALLREKAADPAKK